MPKYNIEAQRTTYYYIEDLEANSPEEAKQMVFMENLTNDIETWAVDWDPVEVDNVEESE